MYGVGKRPMKLKVKKPSEDNIMKNARNLFKPKKVEGITIRDFKNLFEQEEDYYKAVKVVNFCSNNYIEYQSNGDGNKTLSVKEYLNEMTPYLKDL